MGPGGPTGGQRYRLPQALTAAVMSQIRVLVRDVWYTLQTTNLGFIRIAARIVAALARDTARLVPGVRVALGRSAQLDARRRARPGRPPRPPSSPSRRSRTSWAALRSSTWP